MAVYNSKFTGEQIDNKLTNIDIIERDLSATKNKIDNLNLSASNISTNTNGKNLQEVLDAIYPVGSIYMSIQNQSPQSIFGGNWVLIEKGRFLVSAEVTELDTPYKVEKTGGSNVITFNIEEKNLPSHQHTSISNADSGQNFVDYDRKDQTSDSNRKSGWDYNADATKTVTARVYMTGSTGNNEPVKVEDVVPPYLAVYMWYRES